MRSTKCGRPRRTLADARARAANANAAVAPGEQPQIAQAQAAVDKARLDLSRTESPRADGRRHRECRQAAGRPDGGDRARHGDAGPQQYRLGRGELQGKGRRPDGPGPARRRSRSTLIRARSSTAHVQSVGAGTGSEFSLLPAQNANGNWVKVTQRVPVRIAFDGTPVEADDRRPVGHRHRLFRRQQEVAPMADEPAVATHPLPTGERLIVTIGVMMAVLLQVLDTTIANVALPHMQASLSATQDTINWVLTSYIVVVGDRAADQRLARRQGRAQAAAADLGRRVHRRLGAVRDRDLADAKWWCSARSRASAARSSSRSPRRPCSTSTRARSTARRWRCSAAA